MTNQSEQMAARWKSIQAKWQGLAGVWKDNTRAGFEKSFWADYEQEVRLTINETRKAETVVNSAMRKLGLR